MNSASWKSSGFLPSCNDAGFRYFGAAEDGCFPARTASKTPRLPCRDRDKPHSMCTRQAPMWHFGIMKYDRMLRRLQLKGRKFVVALANVQVHKNAGLLLKAFSDPAFSELRLSWRATLIESNSRRWATRFPKTSHDTGGSRAIACTDALCVALPEVGGKAAPDDPRQWVSVISRLAGDFDAREQYSPASREQAGLLTWTRAGEAY